MLGRRGIGRCPGEQVPAAIPTPRFLLEIDLLGLDPSQSGSGLQVLEHDVHVLTKLSPGSNRIGNHVSHAPNLPRS